MANEIALVAAEIGVIDPLKSKIKTFIAGATITKGQAVALAADKFVDPADASADDLLAQGWVGTALNGGAVGQAIDVAEDAEMEGFTVSSLTAGDWIYLSDTAGAYSTVTGTIKVFCGKVVPMADGTLVARIQAPYNRLWAAA